MDLSGNRAAVIAENAWRAGVAERVRVKDGDARCLPFPDHSFDVVVSSLVLHNILSRAGREQAVREIARVFKPGGRVAVLDLRHTRDYVAVLRRCGLPDARREAAGPLLTPHASPRDGMSAGKPGPSMGSSRPSIPNPGPRRRPCSPRRPRRS